MGSRQSDRYWREREMEYLEGELAADWEALEDERKAEQEAAKADEEYEDERDEE